MQRRPLSNEGQIIWKEKKAEKADNGSARRNNKDQSTQEWKERKTERQNDLRMTRKKDRKTQQWTWKRRKEVKYTDRGENRQKKQNEIEKDKEKEHYKDTIINLRKEIESRKSKECK